MTELPKKAILQPRVLDPGFTILDSITEWAVLCFVALMIGVPTGAMLHRHLSQSEKADNGMIHEYIINGRKPKTCEQIQVEIAALRKQIIELEQEFNDTKELEEKNLAGWSIPETAHLGENGGEIFKACMNRAEPLLHKIDNGINITRDEAVTLTANLLVGFCVSDNQVMRWNLYPLAKYALAQIYAQLPDTIHTEKENEQ